MTTSSPERLSPPAASANGLDEQIRALELRLIARDERVRAQTRALFDQAQQTLSPRRLVRRLVKPALVAAGGAALLVVGSLLRRPRAVNTPGGVGRIDARHRPARSRPALPWTQLLALAWPLVPASVRSRISPATAAALASLALPLLGRAVGADERLPLSTMRHVNLSRYAGRWFELARLPAPFESPCVGLPTATYVPKRMGGVGVINRCVDASGQERVARGRARVVPGSGNARLEVSLWPSWLRWLPLAWADYWILHVDDDYQLALVGHPNRRFLWLLSRQPEAPASRVQALVQMAAERGYAVERLKFNTPR